MVTRKEISFLHCYWLLLDHAQIIPLKSVRQKYARSVWRTLLVLLSLVVAGIILRLLRLSWHISGSIPKLLFLKSQLFLVLFWNSVLMTLGELKIRWRGHLLIASAERTRILGLHQNFFLLLARLFADMFKPCTAFMLCRGKTLSYPIQSLLESIQLLFAVLMMFVLSDWILFILSHLHVLLAHTDVGLRRRGPSILFHWLQLAKVQFNTLSRHIFNVPGAKFHFFAVYNVSWRLFNCLLIELELLMVTSMRTYFVILSSFFRIISFDIKASIYIWTDLIKFSFHIS